jgi:hypothetical protein
MITPLIHYEIELANREQEVLRRKAALWHEAHQAATAERRTARRARLRVSLAVLAFAFIPIAACLVARSQGRHPPQIGRSPAGGASYGRRRWACSPTPTPARQAPASSQPPHTSASWGGLADVLVTVERRLGDAERGADLPGVCCARPSSATAMANLRASITRGRPSFRPLANQTRRRREENPGHPGQPPLSPGHAARTCCSSTPLTARIIRGGAICWDGSG